MSDTPLDIASAAVQFMGIRSVFDDIFQAIRFTRSSQEHNSDLSWLIGSVRLELESLDQWGRYVGLHRDGSGSTRTAKPLLASLSAWRQIIKILASCRSIVFELNHLLPPNTEGHSTSPSNMQVPTDPTLETLQYTERITDSVAVVAAMGPYDSGGQSSTSNRIINSFTQNKERIKELVDRLAVSNRRLREEIPNPNVFHRWLASAFGELEIDELRQMRPSDVVFQPILDALIFEKQNSHLLQSDHVDSHFKMKLPSAPKRINAPPGSRTRGLARSVAGRPVLVEWKRITQTTPGFRPKVIKRLDNLARCLHAGEKSQRSYFHMMSCDGWFEDVDSSWLGIVYQLPPSVDYKQEPRSLAEIMEDPGFHPPSLGIRFKLAYQLAMSLQEYHAINWLHKAFNSSNVLFFFDQRTGELRLDDPYVVGFGSSRHRELHTTEGVDPDTNDYASLFQHPDYIVEGFRAAYDVYSLGCIMLELAYWETLVSLKEDFQKDDQTGVEVLEEMASHLGPRVGEIYAGAVVWCLCHVAAVDEDKIPYFFRNIVWAPLESLRV